MRWLDDLIDFDGFARTLGGFVDEDGNVTRPTFDSPFDPPESSGDLVASGGWCRPVGILYSLWGSSTWWRDAVWVDDADWHPVPEPARVFVYVPTPRPSTSPIVYHHAVDVDGVVE